MPEDADEHLPELRYRTELALALLCALLGRVSLDRQLLRPNRCADHLLVRFALVDDQRIGVSPFAGQILVGGFAFDRQKVGPVAPPLRALVLEHRIGAGSLVLEDGARALGAGFGGRRLRAALAIGVVSRGLHDLVGTLAGDPHHLVRLLFDGLALLRDGDVGLVPFDPQALVGLVASRVAGAAHAVGRGIGQAREHFDRLAEHGQVTDRLVVQLDGDALLCHYSPNYLAFGSGAGLFRLADSVRRPGGQPGIIGLARGRGSPRLCP